LIITIDESADTQYARYYMPESMSTDARRDLYRTLLVISGTARGQKDQFDAITQAARLKGEYPEVTA
jgi:hypothetical protein